jgi:hypothetical protein
MHLALARGDVEAYVGAEPGPGVSISSGVGKLVEYPYSTPMGSLNMVFGVHPETVEKSPQLVRTILENHRKASEFAMANPPEMIEIAVAKSVRSARGQIATFLRRRSSMLAIGLSFLAITAMPLLQHEAITLSGSLAAAPRMAAAMPNTPKSTERVTTHSCTRSDPRTGSPRPVARRRKAVVEVRRDGMDKLQGTHLYGAGSLRASAVGRHEQSCARSNEGPAIDARH